MYNIAALAVLSIPPSFVLYINTIYAAVFFLSAALTFPVKEVYLRSDHEGCRNLRKLLGSENRLKGYRNV